MADNAEVVVTDTKTETNAADLLKDKAAPVTDTTTAPVVESEFDVDLDDKGDITPETKVKYTKDKFKELDDDIESDDEEFELDQKTSKILDKVFDRAKDYKKKAGEYKSLAEANTVIENDDQIKSWKQHAELDNEKLIRSVEFAKYKEAGYNDDDAAAKADEATNELLTESEKLFNRRADDIRLQLKTGIKNRATELQTNIQNASKALSLSNAPDPTLIDKAIETLSKTEDFLGLRYGGKNESSKKDFLKPIEAAIKDGSLIKKIQSDPALLAEFALYSFGKDKFKKAIQNRTPTKKEILEKLSAAPHSNGPAGAPKSETVSKDGALKNPKSFT